MDRDYLAWLVVEADRLRQNLDWCRAELHQSGGDGAAVEAAVADACARLDDATRALVALIPALEAMRHGLPAPPPRRHAPPSGR